MTHTPIIGIVQDKYAFPDALHFLELGKAWTQHLGCTQLNLDAQYNLRTHCFRNQERQNSIDQPVGTCAL